MRRPYSGAGSSLSSVPSSTVARSRRVGERLAGHALAADAGPLAARCQLELALQMFVRLGMPLQAGRTRLLIAEALRRVEPEVATSEARAALETFEALGAGGYADATAALLRGLGVKAARAGPKGIGTLTRREREVLYWPPEAGGRDSSPAPGELILAALGSCLASTYVIQATTRGIDIDELEVTLEGWVDFRGQFELAPVRPGLGGIKATVSVRSEADDDALEALGESVGLTSPVYDTIANPVPIEASVDRLPARREQP